jgi:large subunit ribosomal protein L17
MVTSLFEHERIITTRQKGKELKKISEKMITRAKKNLLLSDSDVERKLHNKREIMRFIKNGDVVRKLFDDIAPRFKERNGGYTRIYLIGQRPGDAAEMAIVELVDRKPKVSKASKTVEKKPEKKPEKKAETKAKKTEKK